MRNCGLWGQRAGLAQDPEGLGCYLLIDAGLGVPIFVYVGEHPGASGQRDRTKGKGQGQPGWLSGLALPSAQGMILETRDRVPCQAPCMEPASLSLPVSLPLTLCVSL